ADVRLGLLLAFDLGEQRTARRRRVVRNRGRHEQVVVLEDLRAPAVQLLAPFAVLLEPIRRHLHAELRVREQAAAELVLALGQELGDPTEQKEYAHAAPVAAR